jgi:syntaxin 7
MRSSLATASAAVEKHTSDMRRAAEKINFDKDVEKGKVKLNSLLDQSRPDVQIVHDNLSLVSKYVKLHQSANQGETQRLFVAAKKAIDGYESAHRTFLERLKKASETPVGGGKKKLQSVASDEEEEAGDEGSRLVTSTQQVTVTQDFDQTLHDEVMQERRREVEEIAENIADIHDIFKHINLLVGEQGEKLDVMEKNVETAVVKIEQGGEHLEAARRHAAKSRSRTILFFLILFCVFVIVVAIVFS